MKKIFFVLCALILTNCATPTVTIKRYRNLPSHSETVHIYNQTEKPEQEYLVIGSTSFNKDEETFACSSYEMISSFADACRYIGGDAVMITEMLEPDGTTCFRGTADIIKFIKEDSYAKISKKIVKEYPPIPDSQAITTYSKSEKPTQDYQVLGFMDFEDTGKTFICDSTEMIEAFTKECRQIGGEAVQITDIKVPNENSTCYQGSANFIKFFEQPKAPAITSSYSPTTAASSSSKSEDKIENNTPPATPTQIKKATPSHTIYVAVLETISHGVIKQNENLYLTDVLREVARRVLPTKANYLIMTRENILAMLPPDKSIEECEGGCIVETGRNISADYVAQARINTYGSKITIGVELYHTATGNLISSFNAKSDDLDNLEKEIREKAPDMFSEIKVLEATEK